ncbi:SHOCT domain-containing protein [Prescottella equi]|uniref:SHOCT domain-containing protein n=1 Tax=Rhodococcus hoagii TaxID=43767 RepID=UPI0025759D91|nr:SHOCT domain-containing protein [Prescottella equi]WJJ10010.1 SHOCT domain-containing protein [Prescottella equi]
MDSFWNVVAVILACFIFGAYLIVLFAVFADLFRDHKMSGVAKALWIVFLIFLPFASTLVYVLLKGDDMARRAHSDFERVEHAEHDYVERISRGSRAHQIHEAKQMLDAGLIDDAEFQERKQRALS